MRYTILLLASAGILSAADNPRLFDVVKSGATGNGQTPDTAAINQAIDAATAAGGGTV